MNNAEIKDYTAQFQGGDERSAQERRRRELLATTKISGWFATLIFGVIAGGIVSLFDSLVGLDIDGLVAHPLVAGLDILIGAILLVLGLVASVKTWRRSADAIFYLRLYMVFCFVVNVLGAVIGGDEVLPASSAEMIILPLVFFVYTFKSFQVSDIFPKDYRRIPSSAIAVAMLTFAVPAVTLAIGLVKMNLTAADWKHAEILQSALPSGEFTDGHVVFRAPPGVMAERNDSDGRDEAVSAIAVSSIKGAFSGIVCSGMFTTKDEAEFERMRDGMKVAHGPAFSEGVESSPTSLVHSLPAEEYGPRACVRVKTVRMTGRMTGDGFNGFWRFAVIYAPARGKFAVLSFFDNGDERYIEKLVKAISFPRS